MSIVVSWIELNLSSTLVRRSALAAFDITHGGQTFFADGLFSDIKSTKRVLSLENVTQEVILNLIDKNGNTDLQTAVRTGTYRRRLAIVWKGDWNPATATLSNVVILKQGPMETVNDTEDDGTVTMIISSQLVSAQSSTENIALNLLHQKRISDGLYGDTTADKARADNIFVNAAREYDELKFGKFSLIETTYKKRKWYQKMMGTPAAIKSNQRAARTGSTVEAAGTDFQPAKVYGSALVDARVINAWNPSASSVFTAFGGTVSNPMTGFTTSETQLSGRLSSYLGVTTLSTPQGVWYGELYPDQVKAVEANSRFISVQYAVAAGQINKLEMYFTNLNYSGDNQELSLRWVQPTNPTSSTVTVGKISGLLKGQTVISGIIEVQWGTNDQDALPSAVATSGGVVTNESRGIGHVIVTCTYEATREGGMLSDGFPVPAFRVTQNKTKDYSAYSKTLTTADVFGNGDYSPVDFLDRDTENTFSIGWGTARTAENSVGTALNWSQAGYTLDINFEASRKNAVYAAWGLPRNGEYTTYLNSNYLGPDFEDAPIYLKVEQGSTSSYARLSTAIIPDPVNKPNTIRFLIGWSPNATSNAYPVVGTFNSTLSVKLDTFRSEQNVPAGFEDTKSLDIGFPRVLADYLTDPVAGAGIPKSDLDAKSFLAAEDALRVPKVAHGVMQGRSSYLEYIEDLQDSSGLIIYEDLGLIKCFYRKTYDSGDIDYQFTDSNAESFKFVGERNADRYNRFTLDYNEYIDENQKAPNLSQNSAVVFNNNYIIEDLLQDSEGTLDCPFLSTFHLENTLGNPVPSNAFGGSPLITQFSEYATFLMDKSRLSDEIEARVKYSDAFGLSLGNPFTINTAKYGWTGVNERVFICSELDDTHDGFVTVIGQPHSNTLFGGLDNYPGIIEDLEPPVISKYRGISQPLPPLPPINLQAAYSTADRVVNVDWDAPATGPANQYLLEYKLSTESAFKAVSVGPSTSSTHKTGANAGTYEYRVRVQAGPENYSDYTAVVTASVSADQQADALQPRFDTALITFDSTTLVSADADADLTVLSGDSLVTLSTEVTDPAMLNNTWRLKSVTISNGFSVSTVNQTAAKSVKVTASGFIADTSSVITCTIAYKGGTGVVVDLILKMDVVGSTRNPQVITTTLTSTAGTVFRSETSSTVLQVNVFLDGVLSTNHDDYTYSWQVLNSSNAKKVVVVSNTLDANGNPQLLKDTVAGGPLLAIGDPSTTAGRQGLTVPSGYSGLPADSLCTLTVAVPAVADELRRLAVGAEDVDNFQQFTCNVGNIPD